MNSLLSGYESRGSILVTQVLLDGTTPIVAAGNLNSAVVDCEAFSSALIYSESTQQFDIKTEISDDNTNFYKIDERLNQPLGKLAFQLDIRGARYIRVNIVNDGGVSASPSANVVLSTN